MLKAGFKKLKCSGTMIAPYAQAKSDEENK